MRKLANVLLTLVLLVATGMAAMYVWNKYMYTPWTRDGRVRSTVINVAPDVSGWITTLHARNATTVHEGDVLFSIDASRYEVARDLAKARADAARVEWQRSASMLARRQKVIEGGVSKEESELAKIDVASKLASLNEASANVRAAQIDLDRTIYKAPVSGKVINLTMEEGDYVNRGVDRLAIIDTSSYYLTGYFEETKIPSIHVGDPVDIWLMAGKVQLKGHVRSIDAGISNKNVTPGNELLPDVEATFTWLRLAQRIPVDISIDDSSAVTALSAGMSATLRVRPQSSIADLSRTGTHAMSSDVSAVLP
jgi:multidrug resistance efflux pump